MPPWSWPPPDSSGWDWRGGSPVREGEDIGYLADFLDRDGGDCARAERAFVRRLDGGCSSPVAAFATVDGESLTLRGMDITEAGEPIFDTITGPRSQGEALGMALADRIREGTACTAR